MVRCKVFASIAARAASPWTTDARREETAAKCPPRLLHGTQTPPTGVIDHLGWLHTVSWRSSLVSLSPWSVWVLVCVSVFGCLGECRQCRPDPDSRHTTTLGRSTRPQPKVEGVSVRRSPFFIGMFTGVAFEISQALDVCQKMPISWGGWGGQCRPSVSSSPFVLFATWVPAHRLRHSRFGFSPSAPRCRRLGAWPLPLLRPRAPWWRPSVGRIDVRLLSVHLLCHKIHKNMPK